MKLTRRTLALALAPLITAACIKNPSGGTPIPPTTLAALVANIVASAESALSIVGTYTGLSSTLLAQISNYLGAVGMGVTGVINALQSGAVLSKVDAVVQVLAGLASSPVLAALVPTPIAVIIMAVATAVDTFIKFLPATPTPAPSAPRAAPNALAAYSNLQQRANAIVMAAAALQK